jgi:hypothetical protein
MPHGELFELGVAEALAMRPDLSEETLRAPGTTLNTLIHLAAAMAEEIEFQGARADVDGYLDTARGDALTRYITSEYGIPRKGLTAARTTVTFARDGTDPTEVPAGSIVSGEHLGTRVRFSTDAPVEWGVDDNATKHVAATAVQVGPEWNVPPGTLDSLEAVVTDTTITVAQLVWSSGGNLDESDEDYVARVRDFGSRQVRGTEEAVRIGALEVPAVRTVSVSEVVSLEPSAGGYVVIVGDASGLGNTLLSETVRTALRAWRPLGVPYFVAASQIAKLNITVSAVWNLGQGTPQNVEILKAAIRARVNQLATRSGIDAPETACLLTHAVITEVRPTVPGLLSLTVVSPVAVVTIPQVGVAWRAGEVTVLDGS